MYIPLIQPILFYEFMNFNCLLEKHLLYDICIKMSSFVGLSKKLLHIKCTIIINFFTFDYEDLVKKTLCLWYLKCNSLLLHSLF